MLHVSFYVIPCRKHSSGSVLTPALPAAPLPQAMLLQLPSCWPLRPTQLQSVQQNSARCTWQPRTATMRRWLCCCRQHQQWQQ